MQQVARVIYFDEVQMLGYFLTHQNKKQYITMSKEVAKKIMGASL